MPFGIAEAIATISATMQAIDFYVKHGGTREQVIQTLNINYHPERYVHLEEKVIALNLQDSYKRVFDAAKERVDRCFRDFADDIEDDQSSSEREKLGKVGKACVCRQIKLLKDFSRRLPEDFKKLWEEHECDDFFREAKGKRKADAGSAAELGEPAGV